ncbi:LexA repressor [Bienertia sinuspersici]
MGDNMVASSFKVESIFGNGAGIHNALSKPRNYSLRIVVGWGAQRDKAVTHEMTRVRQSWRAGGLALLWWDAVRVTLFCMSQHHMDATVQDEYGLSWRVTGVYGWPEHQMKHNTWSLLRWLNSCMDLSWVILGDFNEILAEGEKRGGSFLRDGDAFTEEKLDRAAYSLTLIWDGSDHFPIIVDYERENPHTTGGGRKRFKFEARWQHEEGFDEMVKEIWQQARIEGVDEWEACVQYCGQKLMEWDGEFYKKSRSECDERKKRNFIKHLEDRNGVLKEDWEEIERIMWPESAESSSVRGCPRTRFVRPGIRRAFSR